MDTVRDVRQFRLTIGQLHTFLLVTWPVLKTWPNGRQTIDLPYNADNARWYRLAFEVGHE